MKEEEGRRAVDHQVIRVSSKAFKEHESIPVRYTCDGANVNPPLDLDNIPETAKSLALIVDDPDAPVGLWVHWVCWNLPVTHHLAEKLAGGVNGVNDFRNRNYGGPCPPSGRHRYFFKVYALDCQLDLPDNTGKHELEEAMSEHIIGFGELIGWYERNP